MMDQLIIGTTLDRKASYDDFGASVASRKIGMPAKKSIRETVPFSNITYDFSAIDGEVYWEDRTLEYVFEITAETPERLEELKTAFANWVASVHEAELHDPFFPFHHFIATYADMKVDDDEGLDKSTLTVTFTAFPFKVANTPTRVAEVVVEAGVWTKAVITNPFSHTIVPTLVSTGTVWLTFGGYTLIIEPGETVNRNIRLAPGDTELTATAPKGDDVRLEFTLREEVL